MLESNDVHLLFTAKLLDWFENHHRPLPWKGEKDPYLIWLSEIILQQTRVEQGLPYFLKFREKFPDVQSLAAASLDVVMKQWEGLGYYSRARNMHLTAKYIAQELNGEFPFSYDGLVRLKGVGDYTAAAIASFAFGLPHAVVDGNVKRVLTRVFGIESPIDSVQGKKQLNDLSQVLLDRNRPADFNQAIMDFGSRVCIPKNPNCAGCPFNEFCEAKRTGRTDALPVKAKRIIRKDRFFNYLVIEKGDGVFISKRNEKDIWRGLYEFPMVESNKEIQELADLLMIVNGSMNISTLELQFAGVNGQRFQLLTHQKIAGKFWKFRAYEDFLTPADNWKLCSINKLKMHAFPRIVGDYIVQNFLPLDVNYSSAIR